MPTKYKLNISESDMKRIHVAGEKGESIFLFAKPIDGNSGLKEIQIEVEYNQNETQDSIQKAEEYPGFTNEEKLIGFDEFNNKKQ